MNTNIRHSKKNGGFSLVELIIVIAIMAILAGALAPALIKYIEKTRRTTDLATADAIQAALQRVLIETDFEPVNGQYTIVANDSMSYNNPATSIADELFIELEGIPPIKSFPDYYWYVVYTPSTGSVPEVHLTDKQNGTPIYELFPDETDFIENKQRNN